MRLHPTIVAASDGVLPKWAVVGASRIAHVERVSDLMRKWAEKRGLKKKKIVRWAAAGLLHDALRDEDPSRLAKMVPRRFRTLPGPVLHGPAAAERLRAEGVQDEALLLAVAFHTLGHVDLGRLGRALCCADYLEPGRTSHRSYRDQLLARMPNEIDAVLYEIFSSRLENVRRRGGPISPWTQGFYQRLEADRSG